MPERYGTVFSLDGVAPIIADDAFIAPTAAVIGDVVIGSETGIWFHCLVRGDMGTIRIGARTNIQDGTIIHIDSGGMDTHIGDDVTVGHNAVIHACTLKNRAFVGISATVLDGAVIEEGGMLAAGGLLTPGKVIGPNEMWTGSPAKLRRVMVPRHEERRATMREVLGTALCSRRYLVMSCAYFVCGLQLVFLTTHLPNYLAICGQDPMLSATALATIGGVNIFGSWFAGWLGGRYPKYVLLGLLYLSRSCVLAAYFVAPPTPTTTIVFAAAMGMLWLGVIPLVSGYIAELFGTRYMATILGISLVMHQMGSVVGAWGGGLIFDAFGSYDLAWKFGVLVGAAAGLSQILFGGPARPRVDRRPVLAAG